MTALGQEGEDNVSDTEPTAYETAQAALFEAIASQARQQAEHKDHGAVAAALKDLAEALAWAAHKHQTTDD
ncbi:hypothetical protein ACIRP3_42890 [Streptomyces sp. NPDC101209]|uniref:hypothetical protein n=1 Tax=Streptomyces sp. NPDC101209 TaxID=3366129 RepID=UPI00380E63E8